MQSDLKTESKRMKSNDQHNDLQRSINNVVSKHHLSKSKHHHEHKKLKQSTTTTTLFESDTNLKVNHDDDELHEFNDIETKDEKNMLNKLHKATALNSLQHLKPVKFDDYKQQEETNQNELKSTKELISETEIKKSTNKKSRSKSKEEEEEETNTQIKSTKSRSRSITKTKSYKRSTSSSLSSRSRSSSYSSRRSTSRSISRSHSSYSSKSSRRSTTVSSRNSRSSSRSISESRSRSHSRRSDTRSRSHSSRSMSSRSNSRRSSYSRRSSRSSSRSTSHSKRSYSSRSSRSRSRRSSSYSSSRASSKNYKSSRSSRKRVHKTNTRRRRNSKSTTKRSRSLSSRSTSRSRSSDISNNKKHNKDLKFLKNVSSHHHHKLTSSNPTSALPFPTNFNKRNNHHLNKHLNKDNKYSFNSNKLTKSSPHSNALLQHQHQQQFHLTNNTNGGASSFLNRNKNPAFSYTNGYQNRFSFYNNTNLVNNRNQNNQTTLNNVANESNSRNSPVINQQNVSQQQQQTTLQINGVKTAKLSTANLNSKAREELLEKRKLKAQTEQSSNETVTQLETVESDGNNSKNVDNTPAIPITSYTSINDDDDDDDEDEDEDNEEEEKKNDSAEPNLLKKTFSLDLKKRKIEVLKNDKQLKTIKKQKSNESNSDEDDEESTYFNVFKSTNDSLNTVTTSTTSTTTSKSKPKINVNKMKIPVKKQPIIKAGQTQKDRDEIYSLFIGPKLPDNFEKITTTPTTNKVVLDSRQQKLVKETKTNESPTSNNNVIELTTTTTLTTTCGKTSPPTKQHQQQPEGPKLNYTKDELAKYNDLSKMSQLYAKINQVGVLNFGPNGVTEINMVELDQQSVLMNQTKLEQPALIDSNFNLIEMNQMKTIDQTNLVNLIGGGDAQQDDKSLESKHLEQQQQLEANYMIEQNQMHQFSLQTYHTEQSETNGKQTSVEKAIALQLNELEGLSVPKDVTIVSQQSVQHINNSLTPPIHNHQSTTPKESSPKPVTTNTITTSQPLISSQPLLQTTSLAAAATTPQAVLLQNRLPYQPIQPIQILSLQNPNLIQYTTNPVQQLINLQQLQLNNHNQFLQTSIDSFGLNSHILQAANSHMIGTQLAAQQQPIEALIQQQSNPQGIPMQAYTPLQYVPSLAQTNAATTAAHHPQFIQLRPAFHTASLPQQPQFIINSPFYRILPQ